MILTFKQKMMSFAGKYEVYDEEGQVAYRIQGRVRIPKRYDIYNAQGENIAALKSKFFDFMPQFRLFIGDQEVGKVKKKFTFFTQKFEVDCNAWKIDGNIIGWNYSIVDANNALVASMERKMWKMTDQYVLDIVDPKDALLVLMIVLAIDAEKEGH
ncbi:MAG: LURP-one-related family protein [Clostridia bacterium]|nr:LURP-one-related family protein [Clostridia bacterium]